ncbi:Histidinol-phosphate aminotransferase [Halomonadaceae bacterium LMG 33818]|uniref:pyridoxal phosphate-dependent aminotransferase n=1 Tax=Cernens ardua TaxID=3402176 RepID=UPI003EDC53B9
MRSFAAHLDREGPHNPFPGLAALERKLGRHLQHQLGSNEGLDMPHKSLRKMYGDNVAALARRYSDSQCYDLRQSLAALLDIQADQIIVDAGADSLIALCLRAFCEPGDIAIAAAGTYPTFSYFAQSTGCQLIEPHYKEGPGLLAPNLDALVEAAQQHKARVVYLANPDNPSGHLFSSAEIRTFKDRLPADTTLILDEAYHEFQEEKDNTPIEGAIRLRTFSKAYGMAGLRVGYAIANEDVIQLLMKARIHYSVASVSLAIAEMMVLEQDEVHAHIEQVKKNRAQLTALLESKGLEVLPSATNFVAVRFQSAEDASNAQKALLAKDVIVHRPPHPALGHILRITTVEDALTPSHWDLWDTKA